MMPRFGFEQDSSLAQALRGADDIQDVLGEHASGTILECVDFCDRKTNLKRIFTDSFRETELFRLFMEHGQEGRSPLIFTRVKDWKAPWVLTAKSPANTPPGVVFTVIFSRIPGYTATLLPLDMFIEAYATHGDLKG